MPRFPDSFVFGVATSSYQIEGAASADGRGPSIWDTFCRTPGKVLDGHSGDVACDHYRRWEADLDLIRSLNVGAYRFSVAWPRWFPTGKESQPLAAGVAFYDRLVDGLLARGIEPWLTLYHWDLPQTLEDEGGWTNRDTAHRFVEYTDAVARALGDRVKRWITHNEPWCAGILGYWEGKHAPGLQDPTSGLAAVHHILLSHGLALPVLRERVPDGQHGITLNLTPAYAASASAQDALAAQQFDGFFNRWFLDPVYGRGYPADQRAHYEAQGYLPPRPSWEQPGDLEIIGRPIDFLGVNYYSRAINRADEAGNAPRTIPEPKPEEKTAIGWEVFPDGLYDLLVSLQREYAGVPFVITENGAAYDDGPDGTGRVADVKRTAYYQGHLAACLRAIEAGVPLTGYFGWSLMDNFEWAEGYHQRFGLVHVDYETQRRTIKDSGKWYAEIARTRAL